MDGTSITDLHAQFISDLQSKGRSESTIIAYGKDIEQLIDYLKKTGDGDPSAVTIERLEAFKSDLEKTGYTPKSISRKINSIRTFFKYLTGRNVISENPAEKLSHPKFETRPPRVLTEMEYRALRDVSRSDVRLFSIVELLLQTGIRIGELTRLTTDDIKETKDGKFKYLLIREFASHPERKVPLNASALAAINEYLKVRPETESDILFVTKTGNPLLVRNIRTSIDRAFEKAGIKDAKVNDLRNTFIAHHLAHGVSLVTVSRLVGHKRLSTTEKYLDLIRKEENGSQQKLEAL
ncbi:MAG: tyrosine-type recombinase/integrase [Candidatus Dojkabacteria bacterium]|nr:tyrosine-type recombinase/integrase [Candidatus Dojkabacteria bacterium]